MIDEHDDMEHDDENRESEDRIDGGDVEEDCQRGERLPFDGAIPLTDEEKKLGVRRRRPPAPSTPSSLFFSE